MGSNKWWSKGICTKKNLVYFETSAKTINGINVGLNYIANKAYLIAEKRKMGKNNIIVKTEHKKNEKCVGKKKEI